ncbi:hypothetical protein HYFRA_00000844 [Hymenoscyphus fraxineus]|uniref:Uncharacterized protein n=1 Tax=Hymenoscyphus fraxineus TaxID=746836 RepID=A0A9N9KRE5_9HELO|nr:hypothetical protein HYFRA_00000844 [Hymenoscyphus fraxineus]
MVANISSIQNRTITLDNSSLPQYSGTMNKPKKALPVLSRPLKPTQGTLDSWTNGSNTTTPTSNAKVASGRVTKQVSKAKTSKSTKTNNATNKKPKVKSMMENVGNKKAGAEPMMKHKPTGTISTVNVEFADSELGEEDYELEASSDEDEGEGEDNSYPLLDPSQDNRDEPSPWSIPVEQRKKWQKYDTPDKNGRFIGRQLVPWHKPRMMEKLLLHLQYECQREGIALPWAKVVHRLSPGSSGQAALQHLMKSRKHLLREGHMVPPLPGKSGPISEHYNIRGYVRKTPQGPNQIVLWPDPHANRSESLIDPSIVRGSGQYRKIEVEVKRHAQAWLEKAIQDGASAADIEKKATEYKHTPERQSDGSSNNARREKNEASKAVKNPRDASGGEAGPGIKVSTTGKKHSRSRAQGSPESVESDEDVDPADLDSDAEYNPKASKRARHVRKPTRVRKPIKVEPQSDSESSTKEDNSMETLAMSPEPATPAKANTTPQTPPATGRHMKFKLSPSSLQQFPDSAPPKTAVNHLVGLIDGSVKEDRNSVIIRGTDELTLNASKFDDKTTATMGSKTAKTRTVSASPEQSAMTKSDFQQGNFLEGISGSYVHQEVSGFHGGIGELDDAFDLMLTEQFPHQLPSWANDGTMAAKRVRSYA